MLERVKRLVTEHKTALPVILCLLLVGVAYAIGRSTAKEQTTAEKPAVMRQEETQDAERLRAQLDISHANADALQKRLADVQADRRAPSTTYYVQAPTVERAATIVERQIKEDNPTLPRAAREKRDRMVVTPAVANQGTKS